MFNAVSPCGSVPTACKPARSCKSYESERVVPYRNGRIRGKHYILYYEKGQKLAVHALAVLRNRTEECRVEVSAGDVDVFLVAVLIRPRHVLIRNALSKSHVPPFSGRLCKPIAVTLHLSFCLQLLSLWIDDINSCLKKKTRERGKM